MKHIRVQICMTINDFVHTLKIYKVLVSIHLKCQVQLDENNIWYLQVKYKGTDYTEISNIFLSLS